MSEKGQHPEAAPPRKWKSEHFHQRAYEYDDPALNNAKRINIEVKIDGRTVMDLAAREPGIVAIVSRPDRDGIDILIVEPGGARFVDYRTPDTRQTMGVEDWALELLGLQR